MFQTLYRKISPACKTSKFIIEVFFPRKRRWLKRLWKVRKAWTNERKNEKVVEGFTHIDIFWNLFCLKSKKWSKKFRERKLALSFIIKIRSENYLNLKIILAAIHRQVALLIKLLLFITGKLKKIDQYRPFFCLFWFISHHNSNTTNWKIALESNPGPQDSRRRRNHGNQAGAHSSKESFFNLQPLVPTVGNAYKHGRWLDSNTGPLMSEAPPMPSQLRHKYYPT